MSYAQSAKEMNALMDAQITDKEFDEQIAKNKLLHDCKTKGFKDLEAMGLIRQVAKKAAPNYSPLEFAQLASKMVNNGMSVTAACAEFGRNAGDLRHYCNKFGIEYKSRFTKRQWDYDKTYVKIRRLINEKGYRLKDAARKLDAAPALLVRIIKTKGRKYNAATVKIERIKS